MSKNKETKQTIFRGFSVASLRAQVALAIESGTVLYITGAPGSGKTEIIRQQADAMGYALYAAPISEMLPEDIGGVVAPDLVTKEATRLVPDIVSGVRALHESTGKPVVCFLDELNNATPSLMAASFKLIGEGKAGGYAMPEGTLFICAGNDPEDSYVAQDLPAPIVNRMTAVKYAGPTPSEYNDYMLDTGFHPAIVAFLDGNPQFISGEAKFTETGPQPTPRSWEHASKLLKSFDKIREAAGLSSLDRMFAVAGCVGEAAAKMLETNIKFYDALVPFDVIDANPATAPLPEGFAPSYMQALSIAYRMDTADKLRHILVYARRFAPEARAVFVKAVRARDKALSLGLIRAFDAQDLQGAMSFAGAASIGSDLNITA